METRSVTKQQELEQQIGSLTTLMKELKAGQAEQARRQEEQQTKLFDELRTSIQRQEQQLTRLADDHESRLEALTTSQTEAAETVASLEKSFTSTTSAMQDRLGVAEDRLGKLQIQQEMLASKHEELKSGITDELARLEAKIDAAKSEVVDPGTTLTTTTSHLSTSDLRPTAPAFVPSTPTTGGGAEGEGSGSKSVRPPVYDGKSSWEAYLTQFKLLSELNHWTEQQKATYLAISLRGPALTVLTNLPEEQRGDFTALATALKNRFGNNHQAELNRAHLRSRTKKRDESLPELAEDVERLTRLAYPEAAETMIVVLAKDQFIDALPDEDMRLRIRQSRPPTLRQALETALELESYSMASKRAKPVREVHLEKESRNKETKPEAGSDIIAQLEKFVKNLQQGSRKGRNRRSAGRRRSASDAVAGKDGCWGCGQPGHFQRDCPKASTRSGETAAEPTNTAAVAAASTTQDQGNEQ